MYNAVHAAGKRTISGTRPIFGSTNYIYSLYPSACTMHWPIARIFVVRACCWSRNEIHHRLCMPWCEKGDACSYCTFVQVAWWKWHAFIFFACMDSTPLPHPSQIKVTLIAIYHTHIGHAICPFFIFAPTIHTCRLLYAPAFVLPCNNALCILNCRPKLFPPSSFHQYVDMPPVACIYSLRHKVTHTVCMLAHQRYTHIAYHMDTKVHQFIIHIHQFIRSYMRTIAPDELVYIWIGDKISMECMDGIYETMRTFVLLYI